MLETSAGVAVTPERGIDAVAISSVTIVLATCEPGMAGTRKLLACRGRQDRPGALPGCVCTGALLLARAGLLRGTDTSIDQPGDAARECGIPARYRRPLRHRGTPS